MVINPRVGILYPLFGLSPFPVIVTTRIITFLVGNPYKPSFPLLLGRGTTQPIMRISNEGFDDPRLTLSGFGHLLLHFNGNLSDVYQVDRGMICQKRVVGGEKKMSTLVWANYNDVSRGHLKLWFSKGIPPPNPLNSGLGIILICPELVYEGKLLACTR